MILTWARRIFFGMGLFSASAAGMVVATWMQEEFPIRGNKRILATPVVAPGEDLMLGLDLNRDKNCPIAVKRHFSYSDGSVSNIYQEIDKDFGPVGRDQYVLRVPTSPNAPKGSAKLWSEACAQCNPIQFIPSFEVCNIPVTDSFEIGNSTVYKPWPDDFNPRIGTKIVTRN